MPTKHSTLKRISTHTEQAITTLAGREDRTFIAQLDRVVDAGLQALGEPTPDRDSEPALTTADAG